MKFFSKLLLVFIFQAVFLSCDPDSIVTDGLNNNELNTEESVSETGILQLSITDSPTDATNIKSVWIIINQIEYQFNNEWISTGPLSTPVVVDLLTLTNGTTLNLPTISLEVGSYNNIRFILDITDEDSEVNNPGCYVEFIDNTIAPLFVPSGSQSGYKAQGSFDITKNGITEITVDFDLRKMIVKNGNDNYLLKPVLRMVNNSNVGTITVPIDEDLEYNNIIVYAYIDGDYVESESDDPFENEVRFPNSVTSINSDIEGNYILPFLPEGIYDLVIVGYYDDIFTEVIRIVEDVNVGAGMNTNILSEAGDQKNFNFEDSTFSLRFNSSNDYYVGTETEAYDFNTNPNVTLTYGFWISETETTYELWYTIWSWAIDNGYTFLNNGTEWDGAEPGAPPSNRKYRPVGEISWYDTVVWLNALNDYYGYVPVYYFNDEVFKDSTIESSLLSGHISNDNNANGFRLPTEVEWEIAARGGSVSLLNNSYGMIYSGSNNYSEVAWCNEPGGAPYSVGLLSPNQLGLYDMSGNSWEWTNDGLTPDYPQSSIDPSGSLSSTKRVRGGSINNTSQFSEIADSNNKYSWGAFYSDKLLGFRFILIP